MGLFPDLKQAIDNLTKPNKGSVAPKPDGVRAVDQFNVDLDTLQYRIQEQNWFKALPYGFKFRDREGKEQVMFLPINPSNITVVTHYATNVITTLYGTVEEHSEQRYFDIQIEGTTGIAPKYTRPLPAESVNNIKGFTSNGRSRMDVAVPIDPNIAGGFLQQTIGIANSVLGRGNDLIFGNEGLDKSGIPTLKDTGYYAFHRLYKFFLLYKADASGVPLDGSEVVRDRRKKSGDDNSSHPLSFMNYKDNVMYDVSVQRFTMNRSANNPMQYKYSIVLRAYNLRGISESLELGELANRLSTLGLDGIQSSTLLSEVSDIASGVKQIAGGLIGGFNVLGR